MVANFIDISELDGTNGFTINGVNASDYLGSSFSKAGDINGDGIEDIIIGASYAYRNGERAVGEAYVIFGSSNIGSTSTVELIELDGTNGFIIKGIDELDRLGSAVSTTGDINGDGFDDLIVGASGGNAPYLGQYYGYFGGGQNYVIFGGNDVGSTGEIAVSSLDGNNGFTIDRTDPNLIIGNFVSDGGDINGDGFDDFIVAQNQLLLGFRVSDVRLYVVFGNEELVNDGNLNLSDIDGNNGFVITGSGGAYVTSDISRAGDIDGDGFDDLIVTSYNRNQAVVLFGNSDVGNTGNIDVFDLDTDANESLVIDLNFGNDPNSFTYDSFALSGAGDINGDGFDDLIIASSLYDRSAIIFGNSNLDNLGNINFSSLDGNNGFVIETAEFSESGDRISTVNNGGDIDGDGFADLIVNTYSGATKYIIFGSSDLGNTGAIEFADLDALNSLILDDNDNSPYSSNSIFLRDGGDVNGDGFDDLLVANNSVVFGKQRSASSNEIIGTQNDDTLNGTNDGDVINALGGNDSVTALGGNDTIDGGNGDDSLFGNNGNDTISGGRGNDLIWGQRDDDSLAGNGGRDEILGNDGNDTLSGGGEEDTILGGNGNDSLFGNSENDRLFGNNGNDTIFGGSGSDRLFGGSGRDSISGGEGKDTLIGQGDSDILVGGGAADILNGDNGNDTLFGGRDSDRLLGGAGNDSLVGENGNDILFGNSDSDTLVGGKGNDTLWGGVGNDFFILTRGENADTIEDYEDGKDKLVIDSGVRFGDLDFVAVGNNTQIRFAGNGVNELLATVENSNPSNFAVTDFRSLSDGINLAGLNSSNGFILNDIEGNFTDSVSNLGDVNNDGIDDIIIGAPFNDSFEDRNVGESYIIFGGNNLENLQPNDLDGTNGFVINGIDRNDFAGTSVSDAGDINGDGIEDIVIGASGATPGSIYNAGETYIVFGDDNLGNSGTIELADLDGTNGFTIRGIDFGDRSGTSVSSAGDVNGDGIEDIIIGAPDADSTGQDNRRGTSYIVFGGNNVGNSGSLELSELNGNNGFAIAGVNNFDGSGTSVSNAGDINNDGIDDIAIGSNDSESYIIFGSNNLGSSGTLQLADLDGNNGFAIDGIEFVEDPFTDNPSTSVNNLGDVNGDGIDDIIIGAADSDPNNIESAGTSYVIFGSNNLGSSGRLQLDRLNGNNGFAITGSDRFDRSGTSVAGAGDVNGDGINDILVSSPFITADGNTYAGQTYLIFGDREIGSNGKIELASLNGINGLTFNGINQGDRSGRAVSGAGDINNDGTEDFIIGSAESYIVFGSADLVSAFE